LVDAKLIRSVTAKSESGAPTSRSKVITDVDHTSASQHNSDCIGNASPNGRFDFILKIGCDGNPLSLSLYVHKLSIAIVVDVRARRFRWAIGYVPMRISATVFLTPRTKRSATAGLATRQRCAVAEIHKDHFAAGTLQVEHVFDVAAFLLNLALLCRHLCGDRAVHHGWRGLGRVCQ
jgi:hypothetical protein